MLPKSTAYLQSPCEFMRSTLHDKLCCCFKEGSVLPYCSMRPLPYPRHPGHLNHFKLQEVPVPTVTRVACTNMAVTGPMKLHVQTGNGARHWQFRQSSGSRIRLKEQDTLAPAVPRLFAHGKAGPQHSQLGRTANMREGWAQHVVGKARRVLQDPRTTQTRPETQKIAGVGLLCCFAGAWGGGAGCGGGGHTFCADNPGPYPTKSRAWAACAALRAPAAAAPAAAAAAARPAPACRA